MDSPDRRRRRRGGASQRHVCGEAWRQRGEATGKKAGMDMRAHTGDTVTSGASTKGTWTGGAAATGFMASIFGRLGWWWIVGGAWYFYPAPVYPYPDPYIPPAVVTPALPPSLTQSPPQYWYYCPSAKGYYPYVADCPEGWRPVVPQTPPG